MTLGGASAAVRVAVAKFSKTMAMRKDDRALDGYREEAEQGGDGAAGLVHVRRGHGDDGGRAGDAPGPGSQANLRGVRAGLVRLQLRAVAAGELVDDHGADVVAVARIGRTGVPQPDDEPGSGVGHRSSLPWGRARVRARSVWTGP